MFDLDSRDDIDREVDGLLRKADALYRFPTPVDDLVAAQRLHVSMGADSPFAPDALSQAPAELRERVASIIGKGKLLGALDRRQRHIYVAPDNLEVQRRFTSCHEVGHDLCPWQDVRYEVDGSEQLSLEARQQFEAEANYAAVGLLFQRAVFTEVAAGYPVGATAIKRLAEVFGASIHATFWEYVERSPHAIGGVVLQPSPYGTEAASYRFLVRNTLTSASFGHQFPLRDAHLRALTAVECPDLPDAWDQMRMRSPVGLGRGHIVLPARNQQRHVLDFELFTNTYNLFLLLMNPRSASP